MHETTEDIASLQALLDASSEAAGDYLKTIFNEDRRISAERLCTLLTGVNLLVVATVSAANSPLTSPVDGLFYRGNFYFGSAHESVRLRHLRARPQISATHARGEELAVVIHGEAEVFDFTAPEFTGFRDFLIELYVPKYGEGWTEWAEDSAVFARIDPRVMFTFEMRDTSDMSIG